MRRTPAITLHLSSAMAVCDDNLIAVLLTGDGGTSQEHGGRGEQLRVLRACYDRPLPHEQRVVARAPGDDLHNLRALLCVAGRGDHA